MEDETVRYACTGLVSATQLRCSQVIRYWNSKKFLEAENPHKNDKYPFCLPSISRTMLIQDPKISRFQCRIEGSTAVCTCSLVQSDLNAVTSVENNQYTYRVVEEEGVGEAGAAAAGAAAKP